MSRSCIRSLEDYSALHFLGLLPKSAPFTPKLHSFRELFGQGPNLEVPRYILQICLLSMPRWTLLSLQSGRGIYKSFTKPQKGTHTFLWAEILSVANIRGYTKLCTVKEPNRSWKSFSQLMVVGVIAYTQVPGYRFWECPKLQTVWQLVQLVQKCMDISLHDQPAAGLFNITPLSRKQISNSFSNI